MRRYPQYAPRSIYRHAEKCLGEEVFDKRRLNKGRPRKLTLKDERSIIRTIHKLRNEPVSFSSKRIKTVATIPEDVSCRNVGRFMNSNGYGFGKARKKGFLIEADEKSEVSLQRKF